MPAAVETAVYSATPAWHGLGTVLDPEGEKGISIETALRESGLDWEVAKAPSLTFGLKVKVDSYEAFMEKVKSGATLKYRDLEWVADRHAVQRQTDGRAMGVVGNTWEPVQNAEGFQIVTDVIEQAGGTCWIESAGSLEDGRRVWVLAHIDVGLQIAGEKYCSYLLFTNGHSGRVSVTAAALDMRVVCANTLDWGLHEAQESGRIVRVRHSAKASERIQEAHIILGMRNQRAEELARQGEWLVEHTMDDGEFNNFLETLMPIPEEQEGKPAETMIAKRRDQVRAVYMEAPDLKPIRGTAWGALQAVVDYCDHGRNFKDQETQAKAQMGITAQPLKQQAADLAMAFAMND